MVAISQAKFSESIIPPFDSWLSHHQSIGTDQRDLLTTSST